MRTFDGMDHLGADAFEAQEGREEASANGPGGKPSAALSHEEHWRLQEERRRSLLDSIDTGFCILQLLFDEEDRPIDYQYIETNRVFEQQTGMRHALGRTARELVPHIHPFWLDIYGRVALTGESQHFEDSAESMGRWFDVYAFRIGEPAARQVAVLLSDITARKRREADLAFLADLSEDFSWLVSAGEIMQSVGAKLGAYLRLSHLNLVEVDDAQGLVTVNYSWARAGTQSLVRTYRLDEYLSEEVIRASRAGEMVVIRDTQADPRTHARANAALGLSAFVTVPFHEGDVWKAWITVCDSAPRDWHPDELQLVQELANRLFPRLERARTEEALRASEERHRLAMRATKDAIWDWDLASDGVTWSEGLEERFGHPLSDVSPVLTWWAEHIHPEDRQWVWDSIHAATQESGPIWEAEYRFQRRDGTYAIVADRGFIHRDAQGRPIRMVGAMQDVTERKRAEDSLRARAEFEEQLIGIVSHDLRNPLNAILLGTQGLLRRDAMDELQTRSVLRIQSSAERATRMVKDLLDFTQARLGGGIPVHRRPLDLHLFTRQVMEEVQASFPDRDIRVEARGDGRGVWDEDRMAQVITNLVSNALKYSPPGTPVSVHTRGQGDEAVLEVHNLGAPIPAEALGRLFEPLQRATADVDKAGRSVGLGLYIVKHLVNAHGGTIEVESSADRGTTFTVRLPRAPQPERTGRGP